MPRLPRELSVLAGRDRQLTATSTYAPKPTRRPAETHHTSAPGSTLRSGAKAIALPIRHGGRTPLNIQHSIAVIRERVHGQAECAVSDRLREGQAAPDVDRRAPVLNGELALLAVVDVAHADGGVRHLHLVLAHPVALVYPDAACRRTLCTG